VLTQTVFNIAARTLSRW